MFLVYFLQPSVLGLTGSRSAVSYAQALSNIPETQITTLDNGLRVASEESSQPTCTVSSKEHLSVLQKAELQSG